MHSTPGEVTIHYNGGCKCHRTTGLKFPCCYVWAIVLQTTIEQEKSHAIKDNNGNYEAFM